MEGRKDFSAEVAGIDGKEAANAQLFFYPVPVSILINLLYCRVTLVVAYLGWVDHEFGHSSVCLVLPWQMGIWQNRLVKRARWWNIKNPSTQPRYVTTRVTLYILVYKTITSQNGNKAKFGISFKSDILILRPIYCQMYEISLHTSTV